VPAERCRGRCLIGDGTGIQMNNTADAVATGQGADEPTRQGPLRAHERRYWLRRGAANSSPPLGFLRESGADRGRYHLALLRSDMRQSVALEVHRCV
jgi:hypothetical protein